MCMVLRVQLVYVTRLRNILRDISSADALVGRDTAIFQRLSQLLGECGEALASGTSRAHLSPLSALSSPPPARGPIHVINQLTLLDSLLG